MMPSDALALLFIDHSYRKLRQMQGYLDVCLNQSEPLVLTLRAGPGQNSIANLILHLCGNLRQWIGSAIGGLPDVRDRLAEFKEFPEVSREALLALLRETLDESVRLIGGLDAPRLAQIVPTQDGPLAVLQVIYQAVGHFQQHTGQVIFAVKQATGRDLGFYRAAP